MKVIFLILLLSMTMLVFSFCKPISKDHGHDSKEPMPFSTMLDSLQGTWLSTQDSSWQITFSGRVVDEVYKKGNGQHHYFSLYLSDTLVDGANLAITQARINTSSTSGKYLVEVSEADETIFCYKIVGLYVDGTHTTLAYQATWTDKGPNVFSKQ